MDLHTVTGHVGLREAGPWRPGDVWLAGGTWLFSEPQPAAVRLVDLSTAGWPAVTVTGEGGLEIAATATIAELARNPHPVVDGCVRAFLASFKVQGVATVGGNVCAALPAGPMIALAAALDAECLIVGPGGERRVPVTALVTGPGTTALRPGEYLRSLTLPGRALARRAAVRQASLHPHGRSAALLVGTRGPAGDLALTITGSTPRPVVLPFPELPTAAALATAIDARVTWFDDVHGDPDWRRHMTSRLAGEIRGELA
jgi:CO/xanthine dehydrogenase FAD-binding subunit